MPTTFWGWVMWTFYTAGSGCGLLGGGPVVYCLASDRLAQWRRDRARKARGAE